MTQRETAVSKEISVKTTNCSHCEKEVVTESGSHQIEDIPRGIEIVIGGGNHMKIESTDFDARSKSWRKCKMIIKWFGSEDSESIEKKHLCPSCANSLYGIAPNNYE